MDKFDFPGGKRFAFTILDDTDVATVDNVEPVYRLLEHLGMRATKTVWPLRSTRISRNYGTSETLENPRYLAFVRDLVSRGFEVTWHGASMESSERDRTIEGLERFREQLGHYPRIHTSHAENRENLYWGARRIDIPALRLLSRAMGHSLSYFVGDCKESPFWWGDLCADNIPYARNLTFATLNLATINPSMPYRDPSRPLVRYWFSCSDAENATAFTELLHPKRQEQLETEGGFCIVATHFGKEYTRGGEVDPLVRARLQMLSRRSGWFPTTGQLLDWLLARRTSETLPAREWRRMQWHWARDVLLRRSHWRMN